MILLLAALLAAPAAAPAQQADDSYQAEPPQRIRSILIKPGEECPKAEGNEVVVCAPIESPYRVPLALRDEGPIKPKNQAWGARALALTKRAGARAASPTRARRSAPAGRRDARSN